jgi:hypothetical protein
MDLYLIRKDVAFSSLRITMYSYHLQVERAMKHSITYVIFALCIFILFRHEEASGKGMKFFSQKQGSDTQEEKTEEPETRYVKNWGTWIISHEEDIGKPLKEIKEKLYLEFGSKVYVLEEKEINDRTYVRVQLPDTSEYWARNDTLVEKFIVITSNNVLCYTQPDTDYADTILLQPGDFGFFIREMEGWVNAEFLTYRPEVPGGTHVRVGEKWINMGYTEDLRTAKEAYYLNLAYYYIYSKEKDTQKALERLEKAQNANVDIETEITYVIEDLLNELQKIEIEEAKSGLEIITLTPDSDAPEQDQ